MRFDKKAGYIVTLKSENSGNKGRLKLYAIESAIPFYKKIGFSIIKYGEDGAEMSLSEERAKILKEKKKGFS